MNLKRKLEIVVLSDVHLGTYGAHAAELNRYLNSIDPDIIILNGDILDIWQFKKSYFPKDHMETISILLQFIKAGKKVWYLTGNHDDMLRKFSGFCNSNFELADKLILRLNGKTAWFFHGDIFDLSVQGHSKWLAKLGGKSYDYLILLNRWINRLLSRMGKEPVSLSKRIKNSVKKAVKFVSNFEEIAIDHAMEQGYDYVVCGHIHQPKIQIHQNGDQKVTYMNSGDWVENLTALEYQAGAWNLFHFHKDFESSQHQETPYPVIEEAKAYKLIG